MNEHPIQPQFDLRTGRTTFVHAGEMSRAERDACSGLNWRRARGITATIRDYAPSESVSPDVWAESFTRRAALLEVPLVDLGNLGFDDNDPSYMSSRLLGNIGVGREASAWADRENGCVYKLFDMRVDQQNRATLGYKVTIEGEPPDNIEINHEPATLEDTIEKICILHEGGACPTEIVGLSFDGKYLIVKQPRCRAMGDFQADKKRAVEAMKAVAPKCSFGNELWVFHADSRFWCLSDLHDKNIRRLPNGEPTVIDALTCLLPEFYLRNHPKLAEAAERARKLAFGQDVPPDDPFHGVNDDDL